MTETQQSALQAKEQAHYKLAVLAPAGFAVSQDQLAKSSVIGHVGPCCSCAKCFTCPIDEGKIHSLGLWG